MTKNLIEYDPPKMMSLREARMAGNTANRLVNLRDMLRHGVTSATVSVKVGHKGGTVALPLTSIDAEAFVAFLVERDVAFLTSLNVETSE